MGGGGGGGGFEPQLVMPDGQVGDTISNMDGTEIGRFEEQRSLGNLRETDMEYAIVQY